MFASENRFRGRRIHPADLHLLASRAPSGPATGRARALSRSLSIHPTVIVGRQPEWDLEIGGLTVFERLLRALEQRDFSPRDVFRAFDELDAEDLQREEKNKGGAMLLLRVPVLVNPRAIAFLERIPIETGQPTILTGRSNGSLKVVGFLVAVQDTDSVKEILETVKSGSDVPASFLSLADRCREVDIGLFQPVEGDVTLSAARSALRSSLTKRTDGLFAAWISRRISTRLSLRLARTRITPNQVTVLALVPALSGAALLALPNPVWSTAGALLFLISTVLDGCDGEIARLTYQETPRGARLDLLCDNVVLVAVFSGVLVHVFLEGGARFVPLLAAAIFVGMVGCMVTEYVRILGPRINAEKARRAPDPHPRAARVLWYERLASRDFAYLLPFLAWFGSLRYLVWATAIGVNVFWAVLATFVARRPGKATS
ncbi:MAG: CDP-alcohol phosphatidyltransferase family protein [Acidobacteriota bacterium]|nr:CDP-alcohol phosphatidyltransferase family protein [Acidobacteriota bacterium]